MKRFLVQTIFFGLLSLSSLQAQLFAVGVSANGYGTYSVNPSTGAATLLSNFANPPGGLYASSLISDPSLGVAYETAGNNSEYTFSLSTGAVLSTAPLALPFTGSTGLVTNAGGGLLFAVGESSSGWGDYSVNPSTGAATLLNTFVNPPGGFYVASLISNPLLGVAYELSGNNTEYTFSLSTGAILSTAPLALPFNGSSGFLTNAGGGLLFAVGESGGEWGDYSVNPSTGAATLLNNFTGSFYVSSLISNPSLGVAYELSANNSEYTFSLSTGAILSAAPLALPFNGSSGSLTLGAVPEPSCASLALLCGICLLLLIGCKKNKERQLRRTHPAAS